MTTDGRGAPHVRIVSFRLAGISHDEYEEHCRQMAPSFTSWPGLLAKVWLGDPASGRYGGVYVFDSEDAADRSRGTELFRGMLANPAFTDVSITEYRTLVEPTSVTGGRLVDAGR